MHRLHRSLTFAIAAGLLFAVAGCSSKADRIDSGLRKGADFVKAANWDKANVEVRNVLQIDPKNAEAFYLGGQIAEAKREIQSAYANYSKAVELKPDHFDAKVALARIYLLAGEVDKSKASVDQVLAVNGKHVGARTIKAALLARDNDVPGAIAMAKSLIAEQSPPPVDTSMLLAGLYTSQGQSAEGLAVIEAALKGEPKNPSLLQVAAQIAGSSTDAALQGRAVEFLRKSTELAPKNTELWTAWAVYHTRRNELDQAEAVLRAAIKAEPDDSKRTATLLDFLASRRGADLAEKEYLAAIAQRPKDAELRFGLVNLYRASNRAADARRVLQEVIDTQKDGPAALTARNQLAADRLANGKVAEARALVDQVIAASPRDGAALVTRGRIWLSEGNANNAIIDLRAAAKDQPGSAEVAGLLAQAHRRAGESQLAREVLAEAVKFKPEDPDLRMLLAADMADAKEYKEASAEVDAALKSAPENLRAYDFKVQLALAQKDTAGAEKVLQGLKAQFPGQPLGALKLGRLYSDQKKFDLALKEYDEAARLAPNAPEPRLYGIGVLIAQRRFDDANARVEAMQKLDPKGVLPTQIRGDVAVARGDLAVAEQAYRRLIELAPTVAAGYQSLARVKASAGDLPAALAVLQQGEKALPKDLSLPGMRAEWLVRAGRQEEAMALYESLVQRAPEEDAYANNLAFLLIESKGDKPSVERALAMARRFQDSRNPGYLDTLGWAHYKLGQYPEAVAVLERAVKVAPEAPTMQLHLGMALHRQGVDIPRAQSLMRKALESPAKLPNADEARTLLAQR